MKIDYGILIGLSEDNEKEDISDLDSYTDTMSDFEDK